MRIDPRQLMHLLAVAEHGSFNRAAAACGISQPALSTSISQLERKLGVSVLDRSSQGSALNEFGRILVREGQTVKATLAHAAKAVQLKRLGIEGPLRIGVTPSLSLKFMPKVMHSVLRNHPSIEVTLIENFDDSLLPALRVGDVDIILGPISQLFPAADDIVEEVLFEDPFSIGVGPLCDLKTRKSLTLGELRGRPWVLPTMGSTYRRNVEALFMTQNVPWPDNVVLTSSLSLVESIVTNTDRVTLITALQTRLDAACQVQSIPLIAGGKRLIGIKRRRIGELSPLAKSVLKITHEVAEEFRKAEKRVSATKQGISRRSL